jgi:hypothetical protein
MPNSKYLLLVLISLALFGCSQSVNSSLENPAIAEMESIIARDFPHTPTYQYTIPLETYTGKDYNQYLESITPNQSANREVPPPPDQARFRRLLPTQPNDLQSYLTVLPQGEAGYNALNQYLKTYSGITQVFNSPKASALTLEAMTKSGSKKDYQEFGYPIMVDDVLFVYRNHYTGLQDTQTLGLVGNGVFHIYKKINGKWTLRTKMTLWTT